jgi:histone deacetylase 1/2
VRNVARCWTYETAVLVGQQVADVLPYNDYYEYFGPDFRLHLTPTNMENLNTPDYLDNLRAKICENLRCLQAAPGVQMHEVPPDTYFEEEDEEEDDADQRMTQRQLDRRVVAPNEYYEDDFDNDRAAMDV